MAYGFERRLASAATAVGNVVEGVYQKLIRTGTTGSPPSALQEGEIWLDTSTTASGVAIGTAAGTVAEGNDARIVGAAQKSQNLADLASAATARANLSMGNVTNTSDANKPVSTAQQAALDAKVSMPTSTVISTFYVTTSGNDSNDGLSWASAKATVQAAINALPSSNDGVVELGYGNFVQTAEITYPNSLSRTLTIRGRGRKATSLSWVTDLGVGMYGLRPATLNAGAEAVLEGFALHGPGWQQTFTYGVSPASMNGVYKASRNVLKHLYVSGFKAGVVEQNDHSHASYVDCYKNYYGVYRVGPGSVGDNDWTACDLTGNAYASLALSPNASLDKTAWMHVHFGYSPYGIYFEDTQTGFGITQNTFIRCNFEACGNAVISGDATSRISETTFLDCWLNLATVSAPIIVANPKDALIVIGILQDTAFRGSTEPWNGTWGDVGAVKVLASIDRVHFGDRGLSTAASCQTQSKPFLTFPTGALNRCTIDQQGQWSGEICVSHGTVSQFDVLAAEGAVSGYGSASVKPYPTGVSSFAVRGVAQHAAADNKAVIVASAGRTIVNKTASITNGSALKVGSTSGQVSNATSFLDGVIVGVAETNINSTTADMWLDPSPAAPTVLSPPAPTVITVSGTYSIPVTATVLKVTTVGGGGSGAGAGSAAVAQLQAPGGGGASGVASTQVVSVGSATSLTVTIGAGGTGGAGGAAGGNTGVGGSDGSNTTVVGTGISVTGRGGVRGNPSSASSTTDGGGGVYGSNNQILNSGAPGAGSGGYGNANAGHPSGFAAGGGAAGGAATTTNGGGGGTAGSKTGGGSAGSSGASGTAAGVNGSSAAANSAGGGGGGGGGAGTGAGGNGGGGGSGFVIIEVVG